MYTSHNVNVTQQQGDLKMNFKKKAGLALALAAIFTTGGAHVALAGNITPGDPGNVGNIGENVNITGATGGSDVAMAATTIEAKKLAIVTTDGADVKSVSVNELSMTGDGTGTGLITNSKSGSTLALLTVNDGGALNLGDDTVKATQGGTLKDINLGATGAEAADVTVQAGNFVVEDIVAKGTGASTVAVDSGSLTADNIDLGIATGAVVTVGTNAGANSTAGTLVVKKDLDLGIGNTLFLDPAWIAGVGYSDAAIAQISTGNVANLISSTVIAGQNSRLTIGISDTAWLDRVIDQTNRQWAISSTAGGTNFSAALGLNSYYTQVIDEVSGGLMVADAPGPIPPVVAAGTANFAEDSVLAVNAGKLYRYGASNYLTTVAALESGDVNANVATIDDEAKLVIANAKAGSTITILQDFDLAGYNTATDTGWQSTNNRANSNLLFDVAFLRGHLVVDNTGANDSASVVVEKVNAADVKGAFPQISNGTANMITHMYNDRTNNTDDQYMLDDGTLVNTNNGVKFVSRAVSRTYLGEDTRATAKVLEGVGQIAVAAGVPTITNNITNKFASLIADHSNLLFDTAPAFGNEPGQFGLWLTPFYQYSDVDGMDTSGGFDNGYEINFGGAALGMDYNINESFRLGLAFQVGGGDSESQGDFYKTESDFDFWGLSLYGTYTNGAFGLTGDIGYSEVDNDLEQDIPGVLGFGGKLKSQVDSDAFTVGLTGQYRIMASDNFAITPHLGMRYTKISIDDAHVKGSGHRLFTVDTEDQNLFQIPVGVKFSADIVTGGGWTVTPSADIGALFTMGDTDINSKNRIAGTAYRGTINSDVVDSAAFQGALGIKAKADNGISLGLDYGILASGNQTDHSVSGLLRYEF